MTADIGLILTAIAGKNKAEIVAEYKFHPERKWRADYAIPSKRILIEWEGGVFAKSRHTTGTGYTNDASKYNAATVMGWKVLRFTPGHTVAEIVETIEDAIKNGLTERAASRQKSSVGQKGKKYE